MGNVIKMKNKIYCHGGCNQNYHKSNILNLITCKLENNKLFPQKDSLCFDCVLSINLICQKCLPLTRINLKSKTYKSAKESICNNHQFHNYHRYDLDHNTPPTIEDLYSCSQEKLTFQVGRGGGRNYSSICNNNHRQYHNDCFICFDNHDQSLSSLYYDLITNYCKISIDDVTKIIFTYLI